MLQGLLKNWQGDPDENFETFQKLKPAEQVVAAKKLKLQEKVSEVVRRNSATFGASGAREDFNKECLRNLQDLNVKISNVVNL